MSVIHILPEAVANKIAAGEVVERPASVVKELLENSIDAGASRIEVYLEAGGKRLIRVTDDGCGMGRDDALLAFERHATSKIRTAEDLLEISTLGFRGEALPSIAAVSRLALETRDASEPAATHIEIAGGKLRDVKESARVKGTTVEVRDLYFNTPARRKFLKSETTELGHIVTLVTHYALAHPEKSLRLASLTNEIINVPPVGAARERIYQLLGGQLLEQLVEMPPAERKLPAHTPAGEETEPPAEEVVVKVSGFISRPEVQRLNRNHIYFFVNRRLVRDRLLLHAVTEAYRNILPSSVFPVALMFLELPAAEVDVNVHPSKTEVRFRSPSFMHDLVRDSARQALVASQPVAAFPAARRAMPPSATAPPVSESQFAREGFPSRAAAQPGPSGRGVTGAFGGGFQLAPPQAPPRTGALPLESAALGLYSPSGEDAGEFVRQEPAAAVSEFPADLVPLGQVQQSFIVATNSEGLFIIDQHVAHERILFERHVRMRREAKVEGQRLLMPIVVELKPEQQVAFAEIASELAANGFELEPFGQRTVAVKTAPAEVKAEEVERLLVEILDGVGNETRALSLEDLRGKIAASVACHAAIKVNMGLDREKMEWLLRELGRTACPMSCPHGRPILLRYSLREIQRAFKRI